MTGDLLMLAAITLSGLGDAEGALLSRRIRGWQVISWALLLPLPAMLPLAVLTPPQPLCCGAAAGVLLAGALLGKPVGWQMIILTAVVVVGLVGAKCFAKSGIAPATARL